MEPNQEKGLIKQVNSMSMFAKALLLGGLSLLLLIPLMMTSSLVEERRNTAENVIDEVSDKWGKKQSVLSPMLRIPYKTLKKDDSKSTEIRYVWVTPKTLKVDAEVNTQERKRGIYTVPVYTSDIRIEGTWDMSIFQDESFTTDSLILQEARIFFGLNDVKGFKDYVIVKVDNKELGLRPDKSTEVGYYEDYYSPRLIPALLSGHFPLEQEALGKAFSFSTAFTFTGSQSLHVATPGRSTSINIKSNWAHPSFTGRFLPESSQITPKGFEAQWSVVEYNRGYGNLIGDNEISEVMGGAAIVDFIQPVNEYSQSERTIKYGILIILLSFVSIFFIEMSLKKHNISLNLFHYILVGLALVLFYTLLLSMSEIIGFGWAYLIASAMTIGLIGLYFRSLLPTGQTALILVGILAFLYLFIYMLIQLTTYALLVGSLGLFVILALVMYVSSKLIK
ncbi:MAG: cell envelope integrity protein CreD [Porphyromonadaceae bacterium]|nr:cell envelope integrity protein CreD [Porphyromonadaceae bacterium]